VRLWQDDAVAARVDRARDSYQRRRAALLAALAERGLPAAGRSGINIWLPVPDETLALTRLRDAGYAVAPGSMYRVASPPGLRITISPLDLPAIERFADAVQAAVQSGPHGEMTA
jgi:DNA-binding transcriptional MocR family regulator